MWSYLRSSKAFWAAIIFLVAAGATGVAATWEADTRSEIAARGVETEATITDKRRVKGARGRTTREVHLRFVDANSVEHTTVRSDASLWAKSIGETTPIIYLPDDPRTVRLRGQTAASELFMLMAGLTAAGVACGVGALLAARRSAGGSRRSCLASV